jgi:hypothetical protein
MKEKVEAQNQGLFEATSKFWVVLGGYHINSWLTL